MKMIIYGQHFLVIKIQTFITYMMYTTLTVTTLRK